MDDQRLAMNRRRFVACFSAAGLGEHVGPENLGRVGTHAVRDGHVSVPVVDALHVHLGWPGSGCRFYGRHGKLAESEVREALTE